LADREGQELAESTRLAYTQNVIKLHILKRWPGRGIKIEFFSKILGPKSKYEKDLPYTYEAQIKYIEDDEDLFLTLPILFVD
jgi:hypothetical protein